MNYKDEIIWKIARKACKRITSKVIRNLQKMTECTLSGDDSPLKNIWDEVCVQMQDEESCYWDTYLDTIRPLILYEVNQLEEEVRQTIWFQTEEGNNWEEDDEERDKIIFDSYEITDYILSDYLLPAAGDWTNKRIERYIENSCY